jgi:hypothetical protein
MMSHAALDRTLLLMRDDTREDAPDHLLLDALLGTRIALIADPPNLATHSAQSAFIAAAMGFARQGATVHLIAPNSALIGSQPPLQRPNLIDALTEIDGKIIPRTSFVSTAAMGFFDVAVVLGDTAWTGSAETAFRINAVGAGGSQKSTQQQDGKGPTGHLAGLQRLHSRLEKATRRLCASCGIGAGMTFSTSISVQLRVHALNSCRRRRPTLGTLEHSIS